MEVPIDSTTVVYVSQQPDAPVPETPVKRVAMTVRVPLEEHRALKSWCVQACAQLDLPEVALSEVIRILMGRLYTDESLAAVVLAELATNGGNHRGRRDS